MLRGLLLLGLVCLSSLRLHRFFISFGLLLLCGLILSDNLLWLSGLADMLLELRGHIEGGQALVLGDAELVFVLLATALDLLLEVPLPIVGVLALLRRIMQVFDHLEFGLLQEGALEPSHELGGLLFNFIIRLGHSGCQRLVF